MITSYAKTDIGLHRHNNQDSYLTITNNYGDFLAIVCDGIGGAKAGDVASGEMVNYLNNAFKESGPFKTLKEAKDYIKIILQEANKHVYELSISHNEFRGMGTTLTGLLITTNGILSINVGDSRVYGFIDKKIYRLTEDHTLVNQMVANGQITYEESLNHPKKHYLVRACGVWDNVDFDIHKVKIMNYYLLCSDGLCGYVSDSEILDIISSSEYKNCEEKCNKLISLALLKGGYDNCTVIVVSNENS